MVDVKASCVRLFAIFYASFCSLVDDILIQANASTVSISSFTKEENPVLLFSTLPQFIRPTYERLNDIASCISVSISHILSLFRDSFYHFNNFLPFSFLSLSLCLPLFLSVVPLSLNIFSTGSAKYIVCSIQLPHFVFVARKSKGRAYVFARFTYSAYFFILFSCNRYGDEETGVQKKKNAAV